MHVDSGTYTPYMRDRFVFGILWRDARQDGGRLAIRERVGERGRASAAGIEVYDISAS
jgi:hypothetical protein